MTQRIAIVGHADADGHLIAEQVRRNLSLMPDVDLTVVVDPVRTRGHQAWLHLDQFPEIEEADIVFFVDLMFSPADFDDESDALVAYANSRPNKRFFVIDHHPLPLARLGRAANIRMAYRPDVFDCAIGPRSGMMVVAALCERQQEMVASVKEPYHDVLARGMRRAAAPGGDLAGKPLLNLLQADRWDVIYALGEDDAMYHRLVRGRRVGSTPKSDALVSAVEVAQKANQSNIYDRMSPYNVSDVEEQPMPYDAAIERYVREMPGEALKNQPAPAKDLEALVTILEVAALSLSQTPDATFTREELLREARHIVGNDLEIEDRDALIVLEKASFVRGSAKEMRLR